MFEIRVWNDKWVKFLWKFMFIEYNVIVFFLVLILNNCKFFKIIFVWLNISSVKKDLLFKKCNCKNFKKKIYLYIFLLCVINVIEINVFCLVCLFFDFILFFLYYM